MTKLESSFAGLNNKNSHQRKEKKRWRWGVLVVVWPLLRKARLQEKALFAGLGRGANRKAAPTLFEADFSSVITKNYPRGLTHFPLCSSLRSSPAKPPPFHIVLFKTRRHLSHSYSLPYRKSFYLFLNPPVWDAHKSLPWRVSGYPTTAIMGTFLPLLGIIYALAIWQSCHFLNRQWILKIMSPAPKQKAQKMSISTFLADESKLTPWISAGRSVLNY